MDDKDQVKFISSLDFDISKVNQTMKNLDSIFEKNMQELEKKARASVNRINTALGSTGGQSQLAKDKLILDQYGGVLKNIGNEQSKINLLQEQKTKEMQKQLDLLKKQATEGTKGMKQVADEAGRPSPFMARMETALSYGMIYKGIQAMKEASNTIKEVEMGITEIARVSDDPAFNFSKARDSIIQLGIDYGQTFENVQHITHRWAQSGYNISDALELTKTSLLGLNTAELDANAATESMIGIMAQWNLEAKDLSLVLDKVNKVADSFSLTSQDLVDGLLRASGAARVMGLDIDHTIALLTTMREASGRTGREVGNALNSILSYIQRAGSIKVIESMGIRMFADEARTQFRNVFEVFSELADKWNDPNIAKGAKDALMAGAEEAGLFAEELADVVGMQEEHVKMLELETKATEEFTDVQKRDAAQAAAGVFRRNYFIGLLEKFATTQEVLISMNEAEGYSMRENARTMETLEKKVQALQTSYVALAVAIGEAGLLDSLKDIADAGKDGVEAIAKLDSPLKNLIINLGIVLGTIKAAKFTASLFGLEKAVTALGTAISGPVAAALITSIGLLMTVRTHFRKVAEEKQMLLEGSGEEMADIERLDTLITKYSELSEAAKNDVGAKEELLKLQRQLAEEFPEYVDGLDDENSLIVTNIELVKELNRLKKEELELKRASQAKESKEDLRVLQLQEKQLRDKIEVNRKRLEAGDTIERIRKGNRIYEIDITQKLKDEIMDYTKKLQENLIEQEKHRRFLEEYNKDYDATFADRIRKIEDEKNANKIAYVEKMQDSEEFYSKVLSGHDTLVKGLKKLYGYDLEEYKTLAQAKADIETKLLSGLATQWSNYYNAQTGVLSMEIAELQRLGQYDSKTKADFDKIMAAARLFNQLKNISIDTAPSSTWAGTSEVSGDAKSGGSSTGISANESLQRVSQYFELEQAIDKVNLRLAENRALQENTEDTEKLNKLREQEVELYEKMQQALHELNEERRNERDELKKNLSQYFQFDGDNILNFKATMDKKLEEVNKYANDKDKTTYNRLKQDYKDLEASAKRYFDLVLKEIPKASEEWWKYEKSIADANDKIRKSNEEAEKEAYDLMKKLVQKEKEIDERILKQKEKEVEEYLKSLEDSLYFVSETEYNKLQNSKIKSLEQQIKLTEKQLKAKQDDITLQQNLIALQKELTFEQSRTYDNLVDFKEVYEELANIRIQALQDEIDALEREDELQKEIEERERRQLEIQELQLKLQNLQEQKTIQYYKEIEDGVWDYVYVADQEAIDKTQKELKDKQESLNRWERDNSLKQKREQLQNQIKHEQDMLKAKQSSYDKQKKAQEYALRIERENFNKFYDDMDLILEDRMNKLREDSNGNWDAIISDIAEKLAEAQAMYRALLDLQAKASAISISGSSSSGYLGGSSKTGAQGPSYSIEGTQKSQDEIIKGLSDAYAKARAAGDYKGMEQANREANKARGLGDVVTAGKDIEYIKKGGFKEGGPVDFTGLTMVHGSKASSETMFNAADSKKLYDFVHSSRLDNLAQEISNFRVKLNIPSIKSGLARREQVQSNSKVEQHYHIAKMVFPNVADGQEVVDCINGLPTVVLQHVKRG